MFEENETRLAPLYGVGRPPYWRWTVYHRFYSLRQRFCGGMLVHRIANTKLAFAGEQDSEHDLWRRQVATRHARWAPEDAEAW